MLVPPLPLPRNLIAQPVTLPAQPTLADIRAEIDRLDAAMHGLLMERGRVIDTLIQVKKTGASGSAFRPAREAEVLRRLVQRHSGLLPVDTVESIWRVIISTFTYVQAPHAVHADTSVGDAAIRDSARFHFGFTVPFVGQAGTAAVIEAVAASRGDLGLVPIVQGAEAGAWWLALEGANRPRIIARLPFVERRDHPAGLPVFVISQPLTEAIAREEAVSAARIDRWTPQMGPALAAGGVEVLASAGTAGGLSLMLAHAPDLPAASIAAMLLSAGSGSARLTEIGSHAARFHLGSPDKGQPVSLPPE
jgi:chorismate mutase